MAAGRQARGWRAVRVAHRSALWPPERYDGRAMDVAWQHSLTIAAAAFGVAFASSLLLVWRGWRGRQVDTHPLCRRCGYDLVGLPLVTSEVDPADSARQRACPECGADLRRRRAVRTGNRVRHRGQIVTGAVLLVPCLALAGLLAWVRARDVDHQKHKPVWWLANDACSSDVAQRRNAFAELNRRRTARLLSPRHVQSLVERALAVQGNPARVWDAGWGDWLETVRTEGKLSPEQWSRYWRQAWTWKLTTRPRVRRGDPLPVWIAATSPRIGSRTTARFAIVPDIVEWKLGEHLCDPVLVQRVTGTLGWSPARERIGVHIIPDDDLLARLLDGPLPVRCTIELMTIDRDRAGASPNAVRGATASVPARLDVTGTFALTPASGPPVALVTPADAASGMRQSVSVTGMTVTPEDVGLHLSVLNPPLHVACRVVLRAADREWDMGMVVVGQGQTTVRSFSRAVLPDDAQALRRAREVQLVLRPDARLAATTVNMWSIWGADIVVPVAVPLPPALSRGGL